MSSITHSAFVSHTLFPPYPLLSAPRIAGLLPAHAESLIEPEPVSVNPQTLIFQDARLALLPPKHYAVLAAATEHLLRAAVDFLRDPELSGDMHFASLMFTGELDELFEPEIEVFKAEKPEAKSAVPRVRTIAEMNAELEPLINSIAESFQKLGYTPSRRKDTQA